MLRRLILGEFVIVKRADIEFAPGLNALTGETGAGKSILVDAIGLLAGSRGSVEWIRRGAERLDHVQQRRGRQCPRGCGQTRSRETIDDRRQTTDWRQEGGRETASLAPGAVVYSLFSVVSAVVCSL